jgi:hypothetical protein
MGGCEFGENDVPNTLAASLPILTITWVPPAPLKTKSPTYSRYVADAFVSVAAALDGCVIRTISMLITLHRVRTPVSYCGIDGHLRCVNDSTAALLHHMGVATVNIC